MFAVKFYLIRPRTISPFNQKRRGKTRPSKQNLSGKSSFMGLVDRGKSLSDGTVITLQDTFEMKTTSNRVPSSIPRNFTRQQYWYKGTFASGNITSSTTVSVYNTYPVQASLLAEFGSYAAIFDQYCIPCLIYRFIPLTAIQAAGSSPGLFLTVIDHDDSTALTSTGQAQEYSTLLETNQSVGQTRVVFPRIAAAVYSGSFVSYSNTRSWIDCASSTVYHYGLKSVLTPSVTDTYMYAVETDVYVLFRDNH
jgi:hypothetical protein